MENVLDFRLEVSLAIREADVIRAHLKNHLSDFSDFDPDFNATYLADMEAAIEAAQGFPSDETVMDQLQHYSSLVKEEIDKCLKVANDLRYYVGKAFPNDVTTLGEFGYKEIHRVRYRTASMIFWMKMLHNRAVKYQTQLTGSGMAAGDIAALLTRVQKLEEAEMAQEIFKRERPQTTRQRAKVYNEMWSYVTRILNAAAAIYAGDAIMLQVFTVGRSSSDES